MEAFNILAISNLFQEETKDFIEKKNFSLPKLFDKDISDYSDREIHKQIKEDTINVLQFCCDNFIELSKLGKAVVICNGEYTVSVKNGLNLIVSVERNSFRGTQDYYFPYTLYSGYCVGWNRNEEYEFRDLRNLFYSDRDLFYYE